MPLQALRTIAKSQNGVGAFVLQCKRLDFHYCDWAGSSRGMKYASILPYHSSTSNYMSSAFLKHHLPLFAAQNPSIEISVSPRPGRHPVIKGQYINGREKAICVRNMEPTEVNKKAELLKTASGEKLRRDRRPVKSVNESVRGVWSPFHGKEGYRI
ncbi:39S ribosomal protein L51, mitochondrial [Elasticomyces elasticus]|nr:39S ribosomal protein L51, mitochondrial [Elasticomyces elasticus]KAK4975253.1 39S ribosomal protein L51, mitochondrial [Elasticomyces elasticus]